MLPQAVLSVSYHLQPPTSAPTPAGLSPSTTHEFPLQAKTSDSEQGAGVYYAALRDAIAEAKDVTGRELTQWRDNVGDKEKEKTGGKIEVDGEVEGAGEEDQEDQDEVEER